MKHLLILLAIINTLVVVSVWTRANALEKHIYFRTCVIDNDQGEPFVIVNSDWCSVNYPKYERAIQILETKAMQSLHK